MALTVAPPLPTIADSRARAVRLVGALFSPDLLETLRSDPTTLPGQRPRDFGFADERALRDDLAEAYRDALHLWSMFQRRLERLDPGDRATSVTRDLWVIPLLAQLGYDVERNPRAYDLEGRTYAISHRAGPQEDAPPLHIAGARQELGRVDPSGRPRLSPHALVQEFLDRSDHLWGIVTNGLVLRLLRASPNLRTETYLEFDLAAIFAGERFADFVLLYRLLHRTRLPTGIADAKDCLLEQYHQQAREQGARARDRLRDGVEQALHTLGNGFLRHPANRTLREEVATGQLTPTAYYELLLRLVYRFLFLLVTEERGLLGGNDLYRQGYSIERLRRLALESRAADDHADLWAGLLALFQLLRGGDHLPDGRPLATLLDLPVLDGELFRAELFEGWQLANRDLLAAIAALSLVPDERGTLRRVNYAALDVEELGSVYESLLDHAAVLDLTAEEPFTFAPGTERKSTGSYYTPPGLVQALVASALEPVLAARLRDKKTREEREQAILSLNVCDPAAGSGHFLLAAARRLARELARVRTGEEEPAPERVREALRDVVAHCLYGVDKNPLAVELCKVALWIEGHLPDRPLTFLDHRIRCGDSLVGVLEITQLREGIPDEAYERSDPDEKRAARTIRTRNRKERQGQLTLGSEVDPLDEAVFDLGLLTEELERMPERTVAERLAKEQAYAELQDDERMRRLRDACDLWTAAFFADLRDGAAVPTTDHLRRALVGRLTDPRPLAAAQALAQELRFFHWPLEFPDVFAAGGFDVVLGNPPWERVKLQEEEFFAARDPEIARARTAAERKRLIDTLPERNPQLAAAYRAALRQAQQVSHFCRESGRFPLGGRGDLNTYQVFTELAWQLLAAGGRAGLVVPSNVATDDTTKVLFQALVQERALVSLFDFENRQKLFPAVDSRMKFCLLTLTQREHPEPARFAFFLQRPEELRDETRCFALMPKDFWLLNPNTGTCPVFRSADEAELARAIYRRVPVLVREDDPDGNPWGVEFCPLFTWPTTPPLPQARAARAGRVRPARERVRARGGAVLAALRGQAGAPVRPPLGQLRRAGALGGGAGNGRPALAGARSPQGRRRGRADPGSQAGPSAGRPATLLGSGGRSGSAPGPQGLVAPLAPRLAGYHERDERAYRHRQPHPARRGGAQFMLMLPAERHVPLVTCLLANLDALVLDFIARCKAGGTSLSFFILKQLPVLPPAVYARPCAWSPGETLAEWLRPRVLELVYTAWDLAPAARDLGDSGPPFRWEPERRAQLRAELDAAFFLLYGLTRSQVEFVLGTFPVLRANEEKAFGEFRTARLVLTAYDALVAAQTLGEPYRSPLDPPPGDDRVRHGSA
jgi:hypothetical protein